MLTNPPEDLDREISKTLHSALRNHAAPAPEWSIEKIKTGGRRRRRRAQLLPIAAAAAVVTCTAALGASGSLNLPWQATRHTVVVAAADGSARDIVQGYLDKRIAGENQQAYDEYWIHQQGAMISWTTEKLMATSVTIGDPVVGGELIGTEAGGRWSQAVSVPVSYEYSKDGGRTFISYSGIILLVRNSEADPWKIVETDEP